MCALESLGSDPIQTQSMPMIREQASTGDDGG
jgi:hypothetical protein